MKHIFSKKPAPDPELEMLKTELLEAKSDLRAAYSQFDLAVEPELVEASIYQISAVQARCNYLIRIIKARCPTALPADARREEAPVWT